MRLERFDLNLIVALDALLRRRSVTDAAEELHVTQSAMSSALKRVREHFDDEILYYDGQAMVPTSFGRTIENQIPDMLSQLRNLTRMRANRQLAGLNRQFTIIASDYVCAVFVSELIKHLAHVAPNVSLSVLPFTQEMLGQFQRGVVDFLIAPDFGVDASLDKVPLYSDTFSCVLCCENPLAQTGLTEEAYFQSPHVVTQFFREGGQSHLERWLDGRHETVKVAAALSSFVVLPYYLSGTRNIATVHDRLLSQNRTVPGLTIVVPPIDIPPIQEFLITTRKHKHDLEAQMLSSVILDVGAKLEMPRKKDAQG